MGYKMAEQKKQVKLSFLENFMLSGAAAVISKTAAAPIERVKLLIQNQGEMLKKGTLETPYNGIIDCSKRTMASEGIGSFWKGNLANCVRYFPTQALNFAFKDKIKQAFKPKKTDSSPLVFTKNILSGGFAGSLSLLFVYSLDYCRTRLANDLKSSKKGGARQYRGFVCSCVGIFVYRGFYFGLFDSFRLMLGNNASFLMTFALGYTVTVVAGLLSYPVDTIRS